jgi:serine phosphatase RsbU (regulator of sigma subunit)/Tfp pilus assembly protein PilF
MKSTTDRIFISLKIRRRSCWLSFHLLVCLFYSVSCLGQLHTTDLVSDSLIQQLAVQKTGKEKCKLYNALGAHYVGLGMCDTARVFYDKGIHIAEDVKDTKRLSSLLYNKGNSFLFQAKYANALEEYLKSISIREAEKDSEALANPYNTVGIVYLRMNELKKALEYFDKSMTLNLRFKKESKLMENYGNIGMVYELKKEHEKATPIMLRALSLAKKLDNQEVIAQITSNIGAVYIEENKVQEALVYLEQSRKAGGDVANGGIGSPELSETYALAYKELGNFKKAHEYFNKAIKQCRKLNNMDMLGKVYLGLSELYAVEGDMKKAYAFHKLYSQFNDSVFNKETLDRTSDLKAAYEVQKKEKEIKQVEKEGALKRDAEVRRQKAIEYLLLLGFVLLLVLAFVIYRGGRIEKKANEVIKLQNAEIEEKNSVLGLVNKEVADSINYAKRIQEAILPPLTSIVDALPKSFVLYQPKDVVSGDFYFFSRLPDGDILLAACDCTGHGVPGAFMSMIGSEQLGKIINERGITTPSLILDELHRGIRQALQQDVSESRDGMDAILCKINSRAGRLEYSGANRPLWILRKGEGKLEEIRADKQPIGGLDNSQRKLFVNNELKLLPGDRVFMCTDGYADQFGGEKGKKMMVRKFQSILVGFREHTLPEHEALLRKQFSDWKKEAEQVDDILVIGLEI